MGFEYVSVHASSLKPTPDEVTVSPKGNDRVAWNVEGREGDVFMVTIAKGGCFKNAPDGIHQVRIGKGKTTGTIRTEGLRIKKACTLKYSIVRIRDGRVKSFDPRIKIRE